MKEGRRSPRLLTVLAAAIAAGSLAFGGGAVPQPPPGERLPCTAPDEPLNFSTYWAGPSFGELPLTAVLRSCRGARENSVDYIYGDCDASRGGCAAPLDIQNYPASVRPQSLYTAESPEIDFAPPSLPVKAEDRTVDGFPALRFPDRLEIFRPDVTVVIFGRDPERVAEALVEGPRVLTRISAHGLEFDEGCVSAKRGCQTIDENVLGGFPLIALVVALFLAGPAVAFLFRPAPAPPAAPSSAA
jgi:hypothetical protein